VNFDSFSFSPQINAGILAAGYTTPTPIQLQTMPSVLEGRDVLGLAQTGTGKTAAFALPILQHLQGGPKGKPRALIISPTRELAEQTHMVISTFGKRVNLRSMTIYGGVGAQPQISQLRAGVEIVVACPGRLLDLMGQRVIDLRNIQVVVLDEADEMFDMGFLPSIRRILAALPTPRQTLMWSATMPPEIRALANEMLHNPVVVEISPSRPVESVSHALYPVNQDQKSEMLLNLVRNTGSGPVLVFTRTKHRAKRLAEQLSRAGISAADLQGNLSQNRRQAALDGFRSGKIRVLVATDIAARGIDVSCITHVINFDMPDTADAYTHRIGRTGRMAERGSAFTLVTGEDLPMVHTLERLLGKTIERRKLEGFETVQIAATNIQPANRSVRVPSRLPARPASGERASAWQHFGGQVHSKR
jgi:ATP-dependent RNA helicase RhlE